MAGPILLDIREGVARLTLNRPDALNAFNEALYQQSANAIRASVASGRSVPFSTAAICATRCAACRNSLRAAAGAW